MVTETTRIFFQVIFLDPYPDSESGSMVLIILTQFFLAVALIPYLSVAWKHCFFLSYPEPPKICTEWPTLYVLWELVLWIRDILVRIRIRGSVPLTCGSGSRSCSFREWLSRCQQKLSFVFYSFSAYSFLKVYSHQFSMIKSHRIREARKRIDPTDPDPQHQWEQK